MFNLKSPKTFLFPLAIFLASLLYLATIKGNANGIEESTWRKVEEHIKQVGWRDNDPLDSLGKLMKWLGKLRNPGCMSAFPKKTKSDPDVIEALERIEQFRLAFKIDKCDLETAQLQEYLRGEFRKYNLVNLSKMFNFYANILASMCFMYLPKAHNQLVYEYRRFGNNAALFRRMELFFNLLIRDKLSGPITGNGNLTEIEPFKGLKSQDVCDHFVLNKGLPVTSERAAEIAYITIKELVSREMDTDFVKANVEITPTGQPVFNGKQARELFLRFIIHSCKSYLKFFGPKQFQVADLQLQFIEKSSQMHISNYYRKYYIDWAQYEGCERLLDHDHQLLMRLHKIADQHYASASKVADNNNN